MQVIIGIVILVILLIITFIFLKGRQPYENKVSDETVVTIESLVRDVIVAITERLSVTTEQENVESLITGRENPQIEAAKEVKKILDLHLKNARLGNPESKQYIKSVIKGIIINKINEKNINNFIPKDANDMTLAYFNMNYIWEIFYYYVTRKLNRQVWRYLDVEFDAFKPKPVNAVWDESRLEDKVVFDNAKLIEFFKKTVKLEELSLDDKVNIITQIVYAEYKGYNIVDSIVETDMDELDYGCSGYITVVDKNYAGNYPDVKSVWIQYHGQMSHLLFLSFDTLDSIDQTVQQMYEKPNTPALAESNPTGVIENARGARVTCVRPPNAETSACFYRKPSLSVYTKPELLCKKDEQGNVISKNWELVSQLIYYLMQGEITTVYTGQQGTGKTSLMKACIGDTRPMNIRVLETAAELHLRQQYSDRNIISLVPSQYRTEQQLQDILKKTNGALSMIGEIAEYDKLAVALQFDRTASAFTMWSAHQKTNKDLIMEGCKAVMTSFGITDVSKAIDDVLDVITSNVHMDFWRSNDYGYNYGSQRIVAFISEIEKKEEVPFVDPKADYTVPQAINAYNETQQEYIRRLTEVRFKDRDIIRWDPEKAEYVPIEWYSAKQEKRILDRLSPKDKEPFLKFRDKYWKG